MSTNDGRSIVYMSSNVHALKKVILRWVVE